VTTTATRCCPSTLAPTTACAEWVKQRRPAVSSDVAHGVHRQTRQRCGATDAGRSPATPHRPGLPHAHEHAHNDAHRTTHACSTSSGRGVTRRRRQLWTHREGGKGQTDSGTVESPLHVHPQRTCCERCCRRCSNRRTRSLPASEPASERRDIAPNHGAVESPTTACHSDTRCCVRRCGRAEDSFGVACSAFDELVVRVADPDCSCLFLFSGTGELLMTLGDGRFVGASAAIHDGTPVLALQYERECCVIWKI
jgi:hypothetical protein